MARYTAKRAMRCAGVNRRHASSCAASVILEMSLAVCGEPSHAAAEQVRERKAIDENRAHAHREQLSGHDQSDDRDQDRADIVIVEALERREQCAADAARADDAYHRRIAQVGIELVGAEADEPGEDLRQHAEGDDAHERDARRAYGLDLLQRNLLDRLREKLADETDRGDG